MAITNTVVSVLLKQALNLLIGSVWKVMARIVEVYADSGLSNEDKKDAAIRAFKEQMSLMGKELSDNLVNFLLEASVLLFKLNK